jgi:NitT/TauT family transport system ATP-binding protein
MILKCRNIAKVFETRNGHIRALEGINFKTEEQEFLCILGPSGCGKTTLLKIIAGLLRPTDGEVIYDGSSPDGTPLNSLVFQEHGLFPWMNVIDNVSFGLEMRGINKKERYIAAAEVIEKVGLKRFIKNYPHELSVGMKQRVGLARAIVNDPAILLMDEPFGSIDAQTKLILQDELLKIWSQYRKPIIYVTHDIEEAVLLGDRVIVMSSSPGKIKEEIKVTLHRPRDIEIKGTTEFTQINMKIWHIIEDEVKKTMGSYYETGKS